MNEGFLLAEGAMTKLKTLELVVFGVEESMTRVTLRDGNVRHEIPEPAPAQRRRPFADDDVHAIHRRQRLATH